MINFLKQSPEKFDKSLCERFLAQEGLTHEFNEVVELYMADFHAQIDLGGVDSFISETNLVDLSNRSMLKTMDRSRRTEIKRASDINSVLKYLDDQAPKPSKHIQEKKRLCISCHEFGPKHQKITEDQTKSTSQPRKKAFRAIDQLKKTIDPLEILFVNEITQAKTQKSLTAFRFVHR